MEQPPRRLHHHHHHQSKLPSFRHQLPLLLLLLLLLQPIPTSSFSPATNYLLSCGSSVASSLPSSTDARSFLRDLPSSYSNITFVYDDSLPVSASASASGSSLSIYSTARVFRLPSSYYFPISSSGIHILRLHFYPFSSPSFNLSNARFSVSASSLSLLPSFSPTTANPLLLKEFLLDISIPTLTLSFTPLDGSFAFVNAIELFSAPPGLVPNSVNSGMDKYKGFASKLLETIYRVNVGGPQVNPIKDQAWRTWKDDATFLPKNPLGLNVNTSANILYQTTYSSTPEIAPPQVYQSARVMYRKNNPNTTAPRFNLTWDLPVNSDRTYLLRMHFCDIVGDVPNQFLFRAYINGQSTDGDIFYSADSGITMPFYRDYVVDAVGSMLLRVDVGPGSLPNIVTPTINAILNGLEVMELSNGALVLISPPSSQKKGRIGIIAGGIAAGCLLLLAVVILLVVVRRKKKQQQQLQGASIPPPAWSPLLEFNGSSAHVDGTGSLFGTNMNQGLRIPLIQIKLMTNNFDQGLQIGSGGFGKVYRGLFPNGAHVAVKRATPGSNQGLSEFQTEITVLSSIRHRHLVSLIGYCDEHGEMILVYEFMANGTLRDHLYNSGKPCLSWKQRLVICIDAATGLHYLHTGSSQAIIHRDVKSANILLDENYRAKVADFGLSKQGPLVDQTHVSTAVKGSFGYLDPEYFKTQKLTEKSDVYSFGVVLLEVICARPAIDPSLNYDQVNLAEWAMNFQKRGMLGEIVDQRIKGEVEASSLRKFGELVEKCLASNGSDRPSMSDILWSLDYALKLQDSAVHREPHEDSISGPSAIPMVNIQRYPSTNTQGWAGDNSVNDASISLGGNEVFSQIISKEGR